MALSATRQHWAERILEHHDAQGRVFRYVYVPHQGAADLVIHFSAFFGEWGDARPYRKVFGGYFHRLKMLGDVDTHNWLFLCDEFGADGNGTYYTGEKGDFFVERAMVDIISGLAERPGHALSDAITMGSSMGATAALKFGLQLGVRGIVAISPHVDLDICAERQGRWRHVAFICPDGDPVARTNHGYTRQVRTLIDGWEGPAPPPRLFVQACRDDDGVFTEQVEPLCRAWTAAGGQVTLDARDRGGHTSDHATRPLLLDVCIRLRDGEPVDVRRYRRDRRFRGVGRPTMLRRRAEQLARRAVRILARR